ncbi:thioredoxin family protein [Flavobacterium sp. K5-23]|uniref:thioredoxin family protein n=1 Tax=Flavobacterium sp. K5-23 TaxID=2746225 RepID=UPI00200EFED5|nr:thioredoxin family protein [Flavobacterium sp. K5-23]UQD57180.1 thioredoxin family protein [Flavobacterium sp. K5-23]
MRFLFLLLIFIFTQNGIAQTNLKFEESDYQSVLKQSKAEQKPIFIMLYANWCPHCTKMKKEVFTNPLVIDLLNKNYICTWQDVEKSEGIMLKNKFNTKSLPAFLFLDSNETVLYSLKGEYNLTNFILEIKNALDPKKGLPYLEKEFLLDPSNANKCLEFMTTLKKGKEREELSKTAHQYLATQTEDQLISEINWRVISNGVTDIKSREFQFVLQHQKEFEAITSPIRVERKITNIVTELLKPYTENLDTISYNKQRQIAKTIQIQKIDSLIFSYDMLIAERTENWSAYKNATIESVEKYIWDNPTLLKAVAQNYLKHIIAPNSLKEAVKWAKRSLELKDTYDGNILISKLYLKINDKNSAIKYARKSKDICVSMNWDLKEINQLFIELGIK